MFCTPRRTERAPAEMPCTPAKQRPEDMHHETMLAGASSVFKKIVFSDGGVEALALVALNDKHDDKDGVLRPPREGG